MPVSCLMFSVVDRRMKRNGVMMQNWPFSIGARFACACWQVPQSGSIKSARVSMMLSTV
jgi:hypothetical protein